MRKRRRLGLTASAATVVASMIGAGIYTSPGYTLASLGTAGWTLAAWAVGGVIALCGAISYGAIASRIAESGGEYTYLTRTVHPLVGFLAGWVSLTAGFAGAAAVAASSLAVHLPLGGTAAKLVSAGVLIAAGILHAWRVREAAGVQTVIVAGKLAVITAGLAVAGYLVTEQGVTDQSAVATASAGSFAVSLMWIAMSYSGFNAAVYFSEEVRAPRQTVPRALTWGTAVTVLLYLVIVAAVVTIPPHQEVAGRDDPVAVTAQTVLAGTGWNDLHPVSWLICLSQLTSVSALAMAGPRVTAKMASDGTLPKWLSGDPGDPPRSAILLHTVLALALLLWTPLRELLFHVGTTLSLSAAVAVSSIAILVRRGERPRGRAWVLAAPLFVTATFAAIGIAVWNDWRNGVGMAAVLMTGLAAYLLMGRSRSQVSF